MFCRWPVTSFLEWTVFTDTSEKRLVSRCSSHTPYSEFQLGREWDECDGRCWGRDGGQEAGIGRGYLESSADGPMQWDSEGCSRSSGLAPSISPAPDWL